MKVLVPVERLTLGELEALAGAGLAGLLALFFAGVTGEVTGLLQGDAELGLNFSSARAMPWATAPAWLLMPPPATLTMTSNLSFASAVDERGDGAAHEVVVREIGVELAVIDRELAGAGKDADAGGGGLATAGAEINGGFSAHGFRLKV